MTLNLGNVLTPDALKWFELHGKPHKFGTTLDCRCSMLKRGKCSIWEDRPKVCEDYPVGSEACWDAIKKRRPHKVEKLKYLMNKEADAE